MAAEKGDQALMFGELKAELRDSDIVIEVVAPSGQDVSSRSLHLLRKAIEVSYRAFAGPVQIEFETHAVLDQVARRSQTLWLRAHTIGAIDDQASLLKFLARGTLAVLAWMDGSSTHELSDLQQAVRVLAWGTSITTAAQPVLPSSAELVAAVDAWQASKDAAAPGTSIRISTNKGSSALDLERKINQPHALLQSRMLANPSVDMILIIDMPDYLGTGEWKLRYGAHPIVARFASETQLEKFYRRQLDLRPGDALRCRVDVETSYGPDHELIASQFRIVEVVEVLPSTKLPERAEPSPSHQMPATEHPAQLEIAD